MKMLHVLAAAAMAATPAIASAQAMSGATFVMKAGAGDQYEIQSSRLLLTSTHDAGLRRYADDMIRDHTKSTADVKAAAMHAGMHPAPPHLDAMGARDLAALRRAHGAQRDRLYVQQQKVSHDKALALHTAYARSGRVAPLRMAANNIRPVVQHHIDMLRRM